MRNFLVPSSNTAVQSARLNWQKSSLRDFTYMQTTQGISVDVKLCIFLPTTLSTSSTVIYKAGMGKQGLSMPPNNTRKYLSKNRPFSSLFLLFLCQVKPLLVFPVYTLFRYRYERKPFLLTKKHIFVIIESSDVYVVV